MKLTTYKKVFSKFAEQANNASMREIGSRKIGKNNSYGATKSASLRKSLSVTIKDSTKGISATFSVKGAAAEYAPFIYYGVKGTKRNRGADKQESHRVLQSRNSHTETSNLHQTQ